MAAEVRTLAQRSSEAARGISDLIENTTNSVSEGVEMVQDTGRALGLITESLDELAGNISQIAVAGRDQATNIAEFRDVVREMDANIQANADFANRSASAVDALEENVRRLGEIAAGFKLVKSEDAPKQRKAG